MSILSTKELTKVFPGGVIAVNKVTFDVEANQIVGIIGPNGSGKTTLLNLITGFLQPTSGKVMFKSTTINGKSPTEISRLGIGRTFQTARIFRKMTIIENCRVSTSSSEKCKKMIEFLGLQGFENKFAADLDLGQQRLLELGRLMLNEPEVLLLDEPFAGVHPTLTNKMLDYIKKFREDGRTFLIISHDLSTILRSCDRTIVLNQGEQIYDGTPKGLSEDARVAKIYLGA